jgi:sugar transferase (PEP-CTERM/EpsH1 system associated)
MKILQLTTRLPYPPDDGGKIGIFNLTKYLSVRGHKIVLLSIISGRTKETLKNIEGLRKWCDVRAVYKNTGTNLWGLFLNLFSGIPYTISKYHNSKAKEAIKKILSKGRFDLIHIDSLHMAYYGEFIKHEFELPLVLREHNVQTTIMERYYQQQGNPFTRLYAYLQWKKTHRYEAKICEIFDMCLMITREDKNRIERMNSSVKTCIIPAGVDTSYFYPLKIKEEPCSLVFVGDLSWLPNVDGLLWFYNRVWPRIKKSFLQVKSYVVGRRPPQKIRKLSKREQNIVVTGFVTDVRSYVAKCSVFVVPLRIGGGMRLKILEAMGMERPVVATSVGAEGIMVTDRENIMIADSEVDFAERVIELLKDTNLRRKVAQGGKKLIEQEYRWESIVEELEKEYIKVLDERGNRYKR